MKAMNVLSSLAILALLLCPLQAGTASAEDPPEPSPPTIPGAVSGIGTHFEVTDSQWLNVTLDSSETIELWLQSVPEALTVVVEAASEATSAQITLSGLSPNAIYYWYEDNDPESVPIESDGTGSYTFTQDLAAPHVILIQSAASTCYLWDGTITGEAECATAFEWDGVTQTWTQLEDVGQPVHIMSDGITLDGNGWSIRDERVEPGSLAGIYMAFRSCVTLRNLDIVNFPVGIRLFYSSGNTLIDSAVHGTVPEPCPYGGCTGSGIEVMNDSHYNLIARNSVYLTTHGIVVLYGSEHTKIEDTNISNSTWQGIMVAYDSSHTIIDGNVIVNNEGYGLVLAQLSHENYIINNYISDHKWGGISLSDSDSNEIRCNTIKNTVPDPPWYWSTGILISGSMYRPPDYYPPPGSHYNKVINNNFMNNYNHILRHVGWSWDYHEDPPTGGNYYDTYDTWEEGCDDTSPVDGFCDTPYSLPFTPPPPYVAQDDYPWTQEIVCEAEAPWSSPIVCGGAPPVADAGGPYTGYEGDTVSLSASGSTDPDNDIVTYEWDLDGDGQYDDATGVLVEVPIDDDGSFVVGVTVADAMGQSDTDTAQVAIDGIAPTAVLDRPTDVDEGSVIALSLTSPADPSPADTAAGFEYAFDCDDGTGYGSFSGSTSATCPTDDDGVRIVKGKIRDKDLLETEYTAGVSVTSIAPSAVFGAPAFADEGDEFTLTVANASDPSPVDTLAGLEVAFDCGAGSGYGSFGQDTTAVCIADDDGFLFVGAQIRDKDDAVREYVASVTISNVPPSAAFVVPAEVDEGSNISLELTGASDPSAADTAAGFEYAFDCGDGTGYGDYSNTPGASCPTDDDAVLQVRAKIRDKDQGERQYSAYVAVLNVAPVVGAISGPVDPVPEDTPIYVSADFTDVGAADTHSAAWEWGDALTSYHSTGSPATHSHAYSQQGVYTIRLTITDDDGGAGEAFYQYAVVYDPDGGFVTGAGSIDSPPGAFVPDPLLVGRASFGFVSRYTQGKNQPLGNTRFRFKVADLVFISDSYEWLVVTHHKAMFKGVGTINGAGNYGFLISAIDEVLTPSTDVDLFRIKIWDKDNGDAVVYDNQLGDDDDSDPSMAISNGNIVIHRGE